MASSSPPASNSSTRTSAFSVNRCAMTHRALHQRLVGLDRRPGAALALPHHQRPIGAAADLDRLPDTAVADRPHELPVKSDRAADVHADDQLTWSTCSSS